MTAKKFKRAVTKQQTRTFYSGCYNKRQHTKLMEHGKAESRIMPNPPAHYFSQVCIFLLKCPVAKPGKCPILKFLERLDNKEIPVSYQLRLQIIKTNEKTDESS